MIAFLTSLAVVESFISPLQVQPCCISGNSTISSWSPKTYKSKFCMLVKVLELLTCWPSPPGFVDSASPPAGQKSWGQVTASSSCFSSSPTSPASAGWLGCQLAPALKSGYPPSLDQSYSKLPTQPQLSPEVCSLHCSLLFRS